MKKIFLVFLAATFFGCSPALVGSTVGLLAYELAREPERCEVIDIKIKPSEPEPVEMVKRGEYASGV